MSFTQSLTQGCILVTSITTMNSEYTGRMTKMGKTLLAGLEPITSSLMPKSALLDLQDDIVTTIPIYAL